MKKLAVSFCFMLVCLTALAYKVPKPINYVSDYGNLLTENEEVKLNTFLKEYADSTSNQIAILTISYFDDKKEGTLFDFSLKVFEEWKIGRKLKDNGLLFVVVKDLATKNGKSGLRILTGYGLEGALPDAICKRIIESIRPSINEGKYYDGISKAINSFVIKIGNEHTKENSEDYTYIIVIIFIIFIIIILFIYFKESNSGSSGVGFIGFGDSGSSFSGGDSFGGFDGGSCGGGGAGD